MQIYDRFSRPITSLRISITERCNLNCFYCHREGVTKISKIELTPEEIERVVKISAKFGITRVKITGGEPLLRRDVVEIVERISSVEGIKDVSMTTNGILLENFAKKLKKAGLNRINISLDTLDPEKYKFITGGGDIKKVLSGIKAAVDAKLFPVKINVVVMRGLNENEVFDIIEKFSSPRIVIQLIELVNTNNAFFDEYYYNLTPIEEKIKKIAKKVDIRRFMHNRKKYILDNGEVEFVRPMHNTEFCAHCTRMRVTADGKFKPCLMRDDNLVDFLEALRKKDYKKVEKLFLEAVRRREPYFKKV
ncbi:MAG: GTP 3',8-cyclase MoaA [Thermoplasmata archaeon]|nr:MAG: GTP 3',8-cyclase MoaA [Thermoplasmata archaeon]